jgi:hypothetical protein
MAKSRTRKASGATKRKQPKPRKASGAIKQKQPKRPKKEITLSPDECRVVTRAIVASARCLGPENELFETAVQWCLEHAAYLEAVYGSDKLMKDCLNRISNISREKHVKQVLIKHGLDTDLTDTFLRAVYRRLKLAPEGRVVEDENDYNEHFMNHILKHLDTPPNDQNREIYEANGLLLPWYV